MKTENKKHNLTYRDNYLLNDIKTDLSNGSMSKSQAIVKYINKSIEYYKNRKYYPTPLNFFVGKKEISEMFEISEASLKVILNRYGLKTVKHFTKVHGDLSERKCWVNTSNKMLIYYKKITVNGKEVIMAEEKNYEVENNFKLHNEELPILEFDLDAMFEQYKEA